MSYAYTQRKKVVRRLKKEFGDKWYHEYQRITDDIRAEQDGPCIGSLQDIMDVQRGANPLQEMR